MPTAASSAAQHQLASASSPAPPPRHPPRRTPPRETQASRAVTLQLRGERRHVPTRYVGRDRLESPRALVAPPNSALPSAPMSAT